MGQDINGSAKFQNDLCDLVPCIGLREEFLLVQFDLVEEHVGFRAVLHSFLPKWLRRLQDLVSVLAVVLLVIIHGDEHLEFELFAVLVAAEDVLVHVFACKLLQVASSPARWCMLPVPGAKDVVDLGGKVVDNSRIDSEGVRKFLKHI